MAEQRMDHVVTWLMRAHYTSKDQVGQIGPYPALYSVYRSVVHGLPNFLEDVLG